MADSVPKYEKGKLYTLAVSQLQADLKQPRKSLDPQALTELVAPIIQHGVLEPILFRSDDSAGLFIVAGERRGKPQNSLALRPYPPFLSMAITPRSPLLRICCVRTLRQLRRPRRFTAS